MNKKLAKLVAVDAPTSAHLERLVNEGLLATCVVTGLRVLAQMMEDELESLVGPKHAKQPGTTRRASRHGTAPGSVVLGGRRVPIRRPRARSTEGNELELATYQAAANDDLLCQVVVERVLAGLAQRRHRAGGEPVGQELEAVACSTSRSAVSRRFVAATATALEELVGRDLSGLQVVALMIDGVFFAGHCCVAALAVCADGTKVPVGLWLGDTENKHVVTHLLADLVERGLDYTKGLLVVIDGAKALKAAVAKVFGEYAVIQRCQLHKRRNVVGHLPAREARRVDRRLARAFAHRDPEAGLKAARALAKDLEGRWPDAAASLREGLEEMFSVARLGVHPQLASSLKSTNAIESMISVARVVTRNVKRWRDGAMVKRWAAVGVLHAEASFRRVKGYRHLPALRQALTLHVQNTETHRQLRLSA